MFDMNILIEEIGTIANQQQNTPEIEEIKRKTPVTFKDPNVIEGAREGRGATRLRIAETDGPKRPIYVTGSDGNIMKFTYDELDLYRTGGHLGEDLDVIAWVDHMTTLERYERVLRATRPELRKVSYVVSTDPGRGS